MEGNGLSQETYLEMEPKGLSDGLDVGQWAVETVASRMTPGPLACTAVWMVLVLLE